ncbi:MAG: PleD family two-component system response regulator [Planctomycetaceae bacterium]
MGLFVREPVENNRRETAESSKTSESVWRALLIEDRPDQQRRLLHILNRAGAEVTLECNVKAGFTRVTSREFAESRFDLIITNLQIPFPDGVELARKLRIEGCMVPIVMISSQSDPMLQKRALDAGCDLFLTSSNSDEDMIAHLRSAAGKAALS